jgi:hypothetical protein
MKLQGFKQKFAWQTFSVMYSLNSLNRTQKRKLGKYPKAERLAVLKSYIIKPAYYRIPRELNMFPLQTGFTQVLMVYTE